jgi:hypothetical protein
MTQTSMNQRLVRQRKTFPKPVLAGPSYNRAFSQAFPGMRKNESGLFLPCARRDAESATAWELGRQGAMAQRL